MSGFGGNLLPITIPVITRPEQFLMQFGVPTPTNPIRVDHNLGYIPTVNVFTGTFVGDGFGIGGFGAQGFGASGAELNLALSTSSTVTHHDENSFTVTLPSPSTGLIVASGCC